MLSTITSAVFVTAVLSLASTAHAAAEPAVDLVMQCTANTYADGLIYRAVDEKGSVTNDLGDFPAKDVFPLTIGSNLASNPKFPMHPAKPVDHEYKILYDTSLAINVSTGAFAPVAFVEGTNATMGPGMTTWGFYTPYGIFIWYNITQAYEDEVKLSAATPAPTSVPSTEKRAPDLSVHLMGFQWEPVEGYPNMKQLFWNQTQFDEARQPGFVAKSGAAQNADFGMCHGDYSPRILSE